MNVITKFDYMIRFSHYDGNMIFGYYIEEVVAESMEHAQKMAEAILATFPESDNVFIREIKELA